MLYAVRFIDRPELLEVRQAHLQAHIRWLGEHRDSILIAGSLRVEACDHPVGGLWLVESPSKAAIEELLRTDPFWVHGLRATHEIHRWSKAFAEQVLV